MSQLSANTGFYATVKTGLHNNYNPLMEYKDYAERLKSLQIEKGIKTQIELSRWLGFSRSIVSEWMRGECIPSMDTAIKISEKFGCNAQWLLTGDGLKYKTDKVQPLKGIVDISHLSPSRQQEVEAFIRFQESQENKPENTQNKPLTPTTENVGGGGAETCGQPTPDEQWHAEDRRINKIVDRRMKVNFSSADECEDYPSVMARYKKASE